MDERSVPIGPFVHWLICLGRNMSHRSLIAGKSQYMTVSRSWMFTRLLTRLRGALNNCVADSQVGLEPKQSFRGTFSHVQENPIYDYSGYDIERGESYQENTAEWLCRSELLSAPARGLDGQSIRTSPLPFYITTKIPDMTDSGIVFASKLHG